MVPFQKTKSAVGHILQLESELLLGSELSSLLLSSSLEVDSEELESCRDAASSGEAEADSTSRLARLRGRKIQKSNW